MNKINNLAVPFWMALLLAGGVLKTVYAASTIFASVLPASRAVAVNGTATAFATVINSGVTDASKCSIQLPAGITGTFNYQTTDSSTNTIIGTPNTPTDIAAGATQSFVFGITANATFPQTDIPLVFSCASGEIVNPISGINTFLMSSSSTPTPDIVALAATASNDGVVRTEGINSTGAFAVSTVNVGAAGPIIASVDTGSASVPASFSLCQTNAQGDCQQPPSASVSASFNQNETGTFSIFVAAGATGIPLDPAITRAFVRFKSPSGDSYGATSVAVTTDSTINQVIKLSEIIDPVSLVSIVIPDVAPSGSGAKQIGGPAVSGLSYDNGLLRFISPKDLGEEYELRFRLGDDSIREYAVLFEPRLPPPVTIQVEGGDDGVESSSPISDQISAKVDGLIDGVLLPSLATELSFTIHDNNGLVSVDPENYEIYLNNDSFQSVKDLFLLSEDRSHIKLSATGALSLRNLLRNGSNSILLTGSEINGRYFGIEFSFAYGNNKITGQLLSTNNQPIIPPDQSIISIRGLGTNITFSVTPNASGDFQADNLPSDNYEVSLIDPTGKYIGTALFSINGGSQDVILDLLVIDSQSSKDSSVKSLASIITNEARSTSTITITSKLGGDVPTSPPDRTQMETPLLRAYPVIKQTSDVIYGEVLATAGAQNETVQDVKYIDLPQGTGKISIAVTIDSPEYPFYTTNPSNPYNDSWHYEWSCGGFSDSKSGRVNITHASTSTRKYEKDIDISKISDKGPVNCRISAFAANIGDSALSTSVYIAIKGQSPFSIKSFKHKEGLFKDKNNTYHMGIPLIGTQGNRRKFTVEIEYQPIDAGIDSLRLELLYGTGQTLVTENQGFSKIRDGLLKAIIELPELPVIPISAPLGQMIATLTGSVTGVLYTSESKTLTFNTNADTFAVLFETRSASSYQTPSSRRYGDRDDVAGGDGWGRYEMLEYLNYGNGSTLMFNDISGEHAWQDNMGKSLGAHKEHKSGLSVDARYLDENGQLISPMRGDGNGSTIELTLKSAQEETTNEQVNSCQSRPNTCKIVKWIDENRSSLNSLAGDSMTTKIYVGIAVWHKNALLKGLFPNGKAIPRPGLNNTDGTPVLVGEWTDKSSKISPVAGNHEGHIHIGMD